MRLMGSQPSQTRPGNLGPRLHQAAMEADAISPAFETDGSTQQENRDSDVQGLGGPQEAYKQRRPKALPSRPPSIRRTPLARSAQRAPALDMHAVRIPTAYQCWQ